MALTISVQKSLQNYSDHGSFVWPLNFRCKLFRRSRAGASKAEHGFLITVKQAAFSRRHQPPAAYF
jgi:hypothetical protein